MKSPTPAETTSPGSTDDRVFRARLASLKQAGIDKRHSGADLDTLLEHGKWAYRYAIACGIVDAGSMIVLFGDRGNGKTQCAVELIRRACRRAEYTDSELEYGNLGTVARYVRCREIGMVLRTAYGPDRMMTETQAIDHFVMPKLLVIDECQEKPDKEWETRSITLILDKRYGAMKPTVMIANCNERDFATLMGAAVTDRIKEGGGFLKFDWPSFRTARKEKAK